MDSTVVACLTFTQSAVFLLRYLIEKNGKMVKSGISFESNDFSVDL